MTSEDFRGRLNSLKHVGRSWHIIRAIYMFAIITIIFKRVGRAEKSRVASRLRMGRAGWLLLQHLPIARKKSKQEKAGSQQKHEIGSCRYQEGLGAQSLLAERLLAALAQGPPLPAFCPPLPRLFPCSDVPS